MPWRPPGSSSGTWRSPPHRLASSSEPRSTTRRRRSLASCSWWRAVAWWTAMTEFLLITGLSGAGRSNAANTFEDLGWFVIDNLPPALIGKVAELVRAPASTTERVALVVGTGAYLEYLDELPSALESLKSSGARVRILFLDASDEVL